MNKQYKVISSSLDSCSERFTGTKEECEQWVKDNKYRFPRYVTLKIQPAEESARWERDFDIHSGGSVYEQLNKIDDSKSLNERGNVKNQRKLNEKRSFTWLDVQNQIAIERNDINPFYDESAAGDYILELLGKIERDLDLSVVSSVQGGNGDVYIHLGDSHTNSGVPIGPINFTDFSDELIDLVLESDSENDFINNYEENILAYIE